MEFRILGPLEVVDQGRPVHLPRGRGRALLAVLLLRPGEVVSTERLIDELWGETPPPTAVTALHGLVSTLRKRLEPGRVSSGTHPVLQTRPPGYLLAIDPRQVDAHRFRRMVEAAAGLPAPQRSARLRTALGLWRGPALTDFTYEPFAQTAITALAEDRLSAIDLRIDADLAVGRHGDLVAELEELTAEYPLRERLRAHLMLALYRSGRQVEALEVCRDARRALVEELGIEPGPALQGLEQAILRQDPSLDPRPAPEAPQRCAEPADEGANLAWLPPGRKTVTVVFVELAESGGTGAKSDPEALRRFVGRCLDVATEVFGRHGGTVTGFISDVVVAVFGVPSVHEDDALRAVRAAAELRPALASLNRELERDHRTRLVARTGINTGEVVVGGQGTGQAAASGDTVNAAARLQQAAADGEVLLGETTRRLVGDAVLAEPRQPTAPGGRGTAGWTLLAMVPGTAPHAADLDTPMVGRSSELIRLRTAFDRTVRQRRAELVTVVGEAGVGKSRLVMEFANAVGPEARVLTGRCPAYGEGITFWPLREVVLDAAGEAGRQGLLDLLDGEDAGASIATHLWSVIGPAEGPGDIDQVFPAVRGFVEALGRTQPLVVILEDVHWAQPTLLDLVEYLVASTRQAVLLLCLARPELLEQRRASAAAPGNAALLVLEPLGRDDSARLVTDRPTGRFLPPDTVARVVEMSQGNPLFVEQILAALRDEREQTIPPSVQALLAARLDRLGPAERDLLRCASVAGVDFSLEALSALVPQAARPYVGAHLRSLEGKELIGPSRRPFLGRPAFRFRHVLIQLAAYQSMTRQARSELHEQFADWLDNDATEPLPEVGEVVGHHLEQACAQRRQIGLHDRHTLALADRAGQRLAAAGVRAYARYDVAAAGNLLSRSNELLPTGHAEWPTVARHLVEVYQLLGRHPEADTVLTELFRELRPGEDELLEHELRLERARIALITGRVPTSLQAVLAEAERALAAFDRSAQHAGTAQACYILWLVHLRRGETREMERVARRGLDHAERSPHPRDALAARWGLAIALTEGTTPVGDAIGQCAGLARMDGMEHGGVLSELARLRAMLGESAQARELIAHARRQLVSRMRVRRPLMFVAQRSAAVEIMTGDFDAAERELRAALALAIEMGEADQIALIAAELSRVLSVRGGPEEAARFAAMSTEHAPAEGVVVQALSRAATARVRLRRGDDRTAEILAREAVAMAPPDMLNVRAGLHMDLAEILLAAGSRGAARAVGEAIDLYERKGNLAAAEHARSTVRVRCRAAGRWAGVPEHGPP